MNVVKTTTLAIGASLIGSSLFFVLVNLDTLSLSILVMGFVFLLHSTGFLQKYIVVKSLRWYRKKKPLIGIIQDLQYSSYGHVWSKMEPNEWLLRINDALNKSQIKARVKFIRITKSRTRWFIDRYLIILNPYGPKYPEVDIGNLTLMNAILNFVYNGGLYVNVTDIPFFYPLDIERDILYCPTRQELPHYYKAIMRKLQQLIGLDYRQPLAGLDSPFSRLVMVDILATEVSKLNPQTRKIKKQPYQTLVKLKNNDLILENILVHRGIRCTDHVESIVEELDWKEDGRNFQYTPFCYIHYGKGRILTSLIWLDQQTEDIREMITDFQCNLVIKEVRNIQRS